MNKKIVSAVVGFALLASPIMASAQSTDSSEAALIASLTALIQTLTQQLSQLIAMRMQGAGPTPVNPNGIGGTSPTPTAVPVQLDVTSQLSNNAAWTTVTIHGYQSNRNVSIWKLSISCDPSLMMIDPKTSADFCNSTKQYPTSQMADPTQDYEVLSNTVTNNGALYGNVTYVLTALSASGSVLGSNQQMLTIPGNNTSSPVSTNAAIRVTAPNGGEQWQEGVLNSITWQPYGYNPDINPSHSVEAYLERKNSDGSFTTVGNVVPSGKASIHWMTGDYEQYGTYLQNVDHSLPYAGWAPPGQYYIRVVNRDTGASDRSDAPFTILPAPIMLNVNGALASSLRPVVVSQGQSVPVSWNVASGLSNCYLAGPFNGGAAQYVANTGSLNIIVNTQGQSQSTVSLSCSQAPSTDTSDPNPVDTTFNGKHLISSTIGLIVSGTAQPAAAVQVLSPNGADSALDPTKPLDVRVKVSGVSTISVALYKNDQWQQWIEKSVPATSGSVPNGDGSYIHTVTWYTPAATVPGIGGDGAVYKIYVTGQKIDGTGYVDDKSDAAFGFSSGSQSTQSTGTTVTLAPVQGLGNTLAPQGAIVPMVKFSLSNTGSNDAQISSMQFRQVGSGSSAAIKSIEVTDDAGGDYIVPTYSDGSLFNASGFTSGIQNITLRAGQTKTFTASAWMQNNLSGLNSQLITLELGNYGSTAGVNLTGAALPIVGTTDTVSSTLNVCYPPQTSVYGYRCW